jgi:hypothetical protein
MNSTEAIRTHPVQKKFSLEIKKKVNVINQINLFFKKK